MAIIIFLFNIQLTDRSKITSVHTTYSKILQESNVCLFFLIFIGKLTDRSMITNVYSMNG